MTLKYSLLTMKDISSTASCVVKTFLYDEPMTKNLGITKSEFEYFAKLICMKCAREELSYVCKNEKEVVVGFILNEDVIGDDDPSFEKVTRKMDPIFEILKKLDDSYMDDKQKRKNFFFHLFMAGSLKEYRRKGIANKLIGKSLDLAKRRKFKVAFAEATNLKSQNLMGQFGFRTAKKVDYLEFRFNGKNVFKNIGEKYCKLMELKIS